uniref:Uncharacterized protein n=1 Tax=Solanum lycopersicum TaxID=4081 RepID=A0A3Q7IGB0_SOLLC
MKRLKSDVVDTPLFNTDKSEHMIEFNWLLIAMVLIFLFFLSLGRIRYVSSIYQNATLSYIREIKDTFVDQEGKYEMLVDIPYRINPPSLILGFNAYLPNGYEIMLNDEEKTSLKNATNYEEERHFVENIKDNEYKLYIGIMMMYKKERKDLNEVYHEVAVLFNDHHDLLDDLDPHLPCGYDIIINDEVKPLKKSIHFEQVFNFLANNHEYKSILDIMNKCRKDDRIDLLYEFFGFLPDSITTNMLSNLDDYLGVRSWVEK